MSRLCQEHPFADIENIICERCGFCEDVYYADSMLEWEARKDDDGGLKDECY